MCDIKLRFLKDQARFADMDADENSTAANPMGGNMGGGYREVQSGINEGFAPAPISGGLGAATGGGEFDLNQGPTNIDQQRPLTDEVPF